MDITIKTRLDEGIYKSWGGGETVIEYRWTLGPRNLLAAIKTLAAHRISLSEGCGNIGCVVSWLEIGGTVIDDLILDAVLSDNAAWWRQQGHPPCAEFRSPMGNARHLIEGIKRGSHALPLPK